MVMCRRFFKTSRSSVEIAFAEYFVCTECHTTVVLQTFGHRDGNRGLVSTMGACCCGIREGRDAEADAPAEESAPTEALTVTVVVLQVGVGVTREDDVFSSVAVTYGRMCAEGQQHYCHRLDHTWALGKIL